MKSYIDEIKAVGEELSDAQDSLNENFSHLTKTAEKLAELSIRATANREISDDERDEILATSALLAVAMLTFKGPSDKVKDALIKIADTMGLAKKLEEQLGEELSKFKDTQELH